MSLVNIDALYSAVVETLPQELRDAASELPYRLRLAPGPNMPWSEVFNHEVTLSAPALFSEGMPNVKPGEVREAVLAHMLAVIEAFGNDRIEDGQVVDSQLLRDVLAYLRLARDRAILRLSDELDPFASADRETRDAILCERSLLTRAEPTSFPQYEAVSLGKQAVGFPATLALARRTGCGASSERVLAAALGAIWLALQFEDDVMDWEDDWRRGGAWVVCLARSVRNTTRSKERPTIPNALQRYVLESKILLRLLDRSRHKYRSVRRRARALGARRLATWAEQRERHVAALARMESQHAGYVLRMQRLGPWAAAVLR
jgi:hypothetical protein